MKNNNQGFSLLEISAALLILCIGLLSSLTLFHAGLKMNIQTTAFNKMLFVAQDQMENIKKGSFANIPAQQTGFINAPSPYEDIQFKIAVDKPVLLGEPPDFAIKRVTLTVKGFDGHQEVEKEFVTYISE